MGASDFGPLGGLGTAIGLFDASGEVRSDWFADPGRYLSTILADRDQREALAGFIDEALGGEERETGPGGLTWLPVFNHPDPIVGVYLVLDDSPPGEVRIGIGVRIETRGPDSKTSLHLPLFRAAKREHSVGNPLLLGAMGGAINFSADLVIDASAPVPGQAHLGGIGLGIRVPTSSDDGKTTLTLRLKDQQLPGTSRARDLTISVDDVDELDDTILNLVLGLARAQAEALGTGPLASLAGMLGLRESSAVPALPLQDLTQRGPEALAAWFRAVIASPATRSAWLGEVAGLLGGSASVVADEVRFSFGSATLAFGALVTTNAGGQPVVTPTLAATLTEGVLLARAEAHLVRIDLGTGEAFALPRIELFARFGSAAAPILGGDPGVQSVRTGIGLDENRRPVVLLVAEGVRIAGRPYASLDLSSPEALAEVGGALLANVISDLLGQLGPVGALVPPLLGLQPPPGAPAVGTLDIGAFLQNPLAALQSHWLSVVRDHPTALPGLLGIVRNLLADAGADALVVGTGTEADPWRLELVRHVDLLLWRSASGEQLDLAVGAHYFQDGLGEGCTRIETRVAVGIAHFDLAQPSADFAAFVRASLTAKERGSARTTLAVPPFALSVDHVGVSAVWRPSSGLAFEVLAPNLVAAIGRNAIPLALPTFRADGTPDLDAAAWSALETLLGILGATAPVSWVNELTRALGWLPTDANARMGQAPRLRLQELVADPEATLRSWVPSLLLAAREPLEQLLQAVARVLTGSSRAFGQLLGRGGPRDPYRIPLLPAGQAPALAFWSEPDGPLGRRPTLVPNGLRDWRPGAPGLDSTLLETVLRLEADAGDDLRNLLGSRPRMAQGIEALVTRWTGSDGRILPPAAAPTGITVHRLAEVPFDRMRSQLVLPELLGFTPGTVLHVALAGSSRATAWPDAPSGRHIDLAAPGLLPESFPVPDAAAGEWFVTLAGRVEARLSSGDADGSLGQARRLERILAPFAALATDLVMVADAGAGHAVRLAANAVPAVDAVVLLGTPLAPVAFSILDTQPAADTLRLLGWLVPEPRDDDPDDPDLALGRGLVRALTSLLTLDDPSRELEPPAALAAPRTGLAVHALFGVASEAAVRRAITAVIAAGLAEHARLRAEHHGATTVSAARFGISLPVPGAASGVSVSGDVRVELCGVEAGVPPVLGSQRALHIDLKVQRVGGWLVGGPDPTRGPGPRPAHELRALEAHVRVPFGAGAAAAEIVLHEPRVFGLARPRWIVRPTGSSSAADEVVTPALPEVGVLLSHAASAIAEASSEAGVAALIQLLRGLSIWSATGGFVSDAIAHLLHEPAAHLSEAVASAARRAELDTAITSLLGEIPGLNVNLAARSLTLDVDATPGTRGMLPVVLHVHATGAGSAEVRVRAGSAGTTAAGGAELVFSSNPLDLHLDWHRPGSTSPERIALWPPDLEALVRRIPLLAISEAGRGGLEYLRQLDAATRPLVDAVLDALGFLEAGAAGTERRVLPLIGLMSDPAAWFSHSSALGGASGFDPGRLLAFVDAFRPLLGVPGSAGVWELAEGVSIRADSSGSNARLCLALDSTAFTDPDGATGRLVVGGQIGLTLLPDRAPVPSLDLSLGISGAAPGRRAVHLALDSGVSVFLRPDSGPDLSLFPDPPGLGQLAQVAVQQALPLILNALADETGADVAGQVGAVVRALGDVLGLRSGAPPRFDGAALSQWANDPAAAFAARLPSVAVAALGALASALDPLLPGAVSSSVAASGAIEIEAGPVTLSVAPAPFAVTLEVDTAGVPGVDSVDLTLSISESGLDALVLTVGPADIDAGGVSLRPLFAVAAGNAPPGGRRVDIGLGLDAGGSRYFAGRFDLDAAGFGMIAVDGATTHTDAEHVALAMIEAVLMIVANFAMSTDAVSELLDKQVPRLGGGAGTPLRNVLRGVVLEDAAAPDALIDDLLDPDLALERLRRLLVNVADAGPGVTIDGTLEIGIGRSGDTFEFVLGIDGRADLNPGDDVVISIEADSRWIRAQPPAGVALGLFDLTPEGFDFAPSIAVNGVGIRVSRSNAPLLDVGLKLGSIAVHLFGKVSAAELAGGVQVQFSELAVGVAGAEGGNPVAQGIMQDSGSGSERLAPSFSPALAIQKHQDTGVLVSLRAGEGDGPWWLVIQKGFGPIYIEQVGLGVREANDQLESITLLLDGGVSIAGLNAAVDDLGLTFVVASDASPFDPSRWHVDLGGLAVSSDLGGITLAGGLRKFGAGDNVEYIGMLTAKFATYGLSVYGGYGTAVVDEQRFSSFFAFGAINGPIGGPPAFFITGIGGGLGINRGLELPTDMATFGDFVMLDALDPAGGAQSDPMGQMERVREAFPMKRGEFWFAAGVSFNSFALVDGIAVLAVAFGDGLEIALLGLARMALPRPEIALVSIELALLVRFSTKEGVLWVQAQLTDNSWLLHESVRLTGGFAFVIWFGGPNKGQCVITLGGYHPSFHRDGYPVVPRLGFCWKIGDAIVIKGESYFALTSEALMAGGRLEASATFGPAWASVVFGADGIVYFDPFRFQVEVYASISAGITIDVWVGEITISISLGARILVEGPNFRGRATFEVGPVSLTVAFGDTQQSGPEYISWDAFVPKYLEESSTGVARVLTAIAGKGSLPPGTGPGGAKDTAPADGSAERPFEVLSEFELTITSHAPAEEIHASSVHEQAPSRVLGLAPLGKSNLSSVIKLELSDGTSDVIRRLESVPIDDGAFPVGAWGAPQDPDDRKVPKGDVITAMHGVRLIAEANLAGTLPNQIAYHQVEAPGPRKPLPFPHSRRYRAELLVAAQRISDLLPAALGVAELYARVGPWLAEAGSGATSLAALRASRTAPPRLGSLTENLASEETGVSPRPVQAPSTTPIDSSVHPPVAVAVLMAPKARERGIVATSVSNAQGVPVVRPPSLAEVEASLPGGLSAKLIRLAPVAKSLERTLAPTGAVPFTRTPRGASAAVAARGKSSGAARRLDAMTAALQVQRPGLRAAGEKSSSVLHTGEVLVLRLPNAARDVDRARARPGLLVQEGPARVVALGPGGEILADAVRSDGEAALPVPRTTERVAVLALNRAPSTRSKAAELCGWHSGQELAYVGAGTALASGATVRAEGARVRKTRERFGSGWLQAADLMARASLVTTRFASAVRTVVVVLDAAGSALDDLALELEGATRAAGADGRLVAPALIVSGNRSQLVYPVLPDPNARAVSVTVGSSSAWKLAGVLGSPLSAAAVAERLGRLGLDAALGAWAEARGGGVRLAWQVANDQGNEGLERTEKGKQAW